MHPPPSTKERLMKRFDVAQGSTEWRRLRAGKPTASQFHRIFTAKTCKPSSSAPGYRYELLAELIMGRPMDSVKTYDMARGTALESDAAAWYAFQCDIEPEVVGFCTTDDEKIGASPDRLIGSDGLLELKGPSPSQHIEYMLFPKRGVDTDYKVQVQGQLYVCERDWCDICSYHPELPRVIVRVERDDAYIKQLERELKIFVDELELARIDFERIYGKIEPKGLGECPEFISDADLEAILARRKAEITPTESRA